jgi:hypothetical protein
LIEDCPDVVNDFNQKFQNNEKRKSENQRASKKAKMTPIAKELQEVQMEE